MNFEIEEGHCRNHFLRDERVAAHVVVRSGPSPRLVVAFPAGNTGVGMWFASECQLWVERPITTFERDGHRGIEFTLRCSASSLRASRWAAGNLRMVRLVDQELPTAEDFRCTPQLGSSHVSLQRSSLDGAHSYRLEMSLRAGSIEETPDGLCFRSEQDLEIMVRASSDEVPLLRLAPGELVTENAGGDQRARDVLAFLAYQDKLCAGSWRFLSYFGRDTLLALRLMMPVLSPVLIEAGLASVLERLSSSGRVAHEEALGEWAQHTDARAPSYDWTMVDDDFMLAPVAAAYLLDDPRGRERAADFLARQTSSGESLTSRLLANLRYVTAAARPFAKEPCVDTLIHIAAEGRVGNWRDSQGGLGDARVPWDVNAVLVPAALRAAQRLSALSGIDEKERREAQHLATAWKQARAFFSVTVEAEELNEAVSRFCEQHDLQPPAPAAESIRFDALALHEDGRPSRVMHSDLGYALLFGEPSAADLEELLALVQRPFPQGLGTDIGIPIANPVLASAEAASGLSRDDYHGCVMWPWQHAMWITGLRTHGHRRDLPTRTREAMRELADRLADTTGRVSELRTAELWSWEARAGRMVAVPFGQEDHHRAESNAAQLWSTMDLILHAADRDRGS